MEKYLVTGGAGFIGSHIVEVLLEQGHFVRVIDNFDTGLRTNLTFQHGEAEIVEGSIEDYSLLKEAMRGIDYVLHQAARGSVPRSIADPVGTHNANITGTLNVLNAARESGVRRVVSASSSSVYGDTPELPKVETMRSNPKSPYAISKLVLEHYSNVFYQVYGLETVTLKYFNVYGPRQNPNLQYSAVIPIFIKNMLQQKTCKIYGDGEQTRDFTFIADCVAANLLACKAEGVCGQVFNIACGRQTSVNQLFQILSKILGNELPPAYQPARPGDVRHSFANIDQAKTKLRYEPEFSLEEGLTRTVNWYKKELLPA